MKLTKEEAEFLADKVFWEWKYAEVDVWSAEFSKNEEAIKHCKKEEAWYKNLYERLNKEANK